MSPIIQILTAELPGKTPIFCARMGTVFGGVNLAGLVFEIKNDPPVLLDEFRLLYSGSHEGLPDDQSERGAEKTLCMMMQNLRYPKVFIVDDEDSFEVPLVRIPQGVGISPEPTKEPLVVNYYKIFGLKLDSPIFQIVWPYPIKLRRKTEVRLYVMGERSAVEAHS